MDAVSYSHADKQKQRIEKFIEQPDSTSGVVTVPKVIGAGENITVPAGRVAVLPNVQVDGTLVVDGEVFIPSGSSVSTTEVDATVVKQNGNVVANDSAVVHKTGDETIAGVKTLTDGLKLQNQNVSPFSGFKNYIINGKKVINQRGLSSTDNSYNQDRWYKAGNNWYQGIEGNNNLVNGNTYTLSWTGTAIASYYVGTATSNTINAQTFTPIVNGGSFNLTIAPQQNLWIKFNSDATGSTFNFVQLEEGSVATPFEQRPYGLELGLCQRYYRKMYVLDFAAVMYTPNGDTRMTPIPLGDMRAAPTVSPASFSNTSINFGFSDWQINKPTVTWVVSLQQVNNNYSFNFQQNGYYSGYLNDVVAVGAQCYTTFSFEAEL